MKVNLDEVNISNLCRLNLQVEVMKQDLEDVGETIEPIIEKFIHQNKSSNAALDHNL